MPRQPRLHVPGGLYHVILRGNGRQDIFFDTDDRRRWELLIAEGLTRYPHRIHAYCWMTNHVHMAIQCNEDPLANIIRFVASGYARSTNKKLNRCGHLFERRYRAILIEADAYLLQLVRYIHRNPLRAGLVEDLSRYRWSSHLSYLHGSGPAWLTVDWVMAMIGSTIGCAGSQYRRFMAEGESESTTDQPKLSKGDTSDGRILGSDNFLASVGQTIRPKRSTRALMDIAEEVCLGHGLAVDDLKSPSRERKLAQVRAEIAVRAIDGGVATNAEVAKAFDRSQAALSRAAVRLRRQKRKSNS